MGKPTLDLDALVLGSRTAEESTGRPFYVITFGSVDLRTQDKTAAQTIMMGLVGFDEVTATLRTFGSLEEQDYHDRFSSEQYEIRKAFDHDWRKWMEHQKREEAEETRRRVGEKLEIRPAPPPAADPPGPAGDKDDVPF